MKCVKELEALRNKNLNEEELQELCNTAITFFQQENYETAARFFILAHQKGFAREEIGRTVLECYFEPNANSLRECYEQNAARLRSYPYMMQKAFPLFDELTACMIPISDEAYAMYDAVKNEFVELYQSHRQRDRRPFFQQIEKPLLIENESNPWNIKYLCENVRRSEDYGGDNHIYLYYDSFDKFCAILQTMDVTKYLTEEKLVFIVGQAQLDLYYPLDFKTMFGIDYDQMETRPLRLEEINRICMFYPVTLATGISFFREIMDYHPALLTAENAQSQFIDFQSFPLLYEILLKNRNPLQVLHLLRLSSPCIWEQVERISDKDHRATIENFIRNRKDLFKRMAALLKKADRPSKALWFKAYFVAYAYEAKREFKERIAPVIFYSPHWPRNYFFWSLDILSEFKEFSILSLLRDNYVQLGSDLHHHGTVCKSDSMELLRDQVIALYDHANMRKRLGETLAKLGYAADDQFLDRHVALVRFEDLKLHAKATLTSLCEFIDIPLRDTLFHCTYGGMSKSFNNRGFDTSPVGKKREECNLFDYFRLELLSFGIYQHWGYEYKFYDGTPYTKEEILRMCDLPFKIETLQMRGPHYDKETHDRFKAQFMQAVNWWLSDEIREQIRLLKPMRRLEPKADLLEGELYS